MSYQNLNQVTCPLTFPIPHCDDTVQDIDTEAKYFIAVDMKSGYWEVVAKDKARGRLAFFVLDVKRLCKVIHMGALNAAPTFVATKMNIQME